MRERFLKRRMRLPTCLAIVVASALVSSARATDESFFVEKLYPVLHAAQCVRCHSDNGVASETQLEFPLEGRTVVLQLQEPPPASVAARVL